MFNSVFFLFRVLFEQSCLDINNQDKFVLTLVNGQSKYLYRLINPKYQEKLNLWE